MQTIIIAPKVSVIIPTRNRFLTLIEAIESIQNQTYSNIEIIIIDDGSSKKIKYTDIHNALKCNKFPIVILRNDNSQGAAYSRNLGIQISTGEFIAFLDDDDTYANNKIELLINFLLSHEGKKFDLVFGKILMVNNNISKHPIKYPYFFSNTINIALMNYIHTNSCLIRKESLTNIKFYDKLERFQDLQFFTEASLKLTIKFINTTVAIWNVNHSKTQITHDDTNNTIIKYFSFETLLNYLENHLKIRKYLLAVHYLHSIQFIINAYGFSKLFTLNYAKRIAYIFLGLPFIIIRKCIF